MAQLRYSLLLNSTDIVIVLQNLKGGSVSIVVLDILPVQSVNNTGWDFFFRLIEQGTFLDSFLFSIKFRRVGLYLIEDRCEHLRSFDRLKFIGAKNSPTSDGHFLGFASSNRRFSVLRSFHR